MSELKPCLKCGSLPPKPFPTGSSGAFWPKYKLLHICHNPSATHVECEITCYGATEEETVEAWNRRPEPPARKLTVEELRGMNGEPVWLVDLKTQYAEWGIMRIMEASKKWFTAIGGGTRGFGDKDNYGKTWVAYDRKPEE